MTNELKKVYDTIVERDAAVRRHFNQDKLFGVKLMCSIDNLMNLLLEECSSVSSPRDVNENYFCWNDLCFQLERNYFRCNLPASLSSKRSSTPDHTKWGDKKPNTDKTDDDRIINRFTIGRLDRSSWKKIFSFKNLERRPNHSSGDKLCHRWATRGYCFDNCAQKRSHCEWSKQEIKDFSKWSKESKE